MKSLHTNGALRLAVLFLTIVPSLVSAQDQADDEPYQCKPYQWSSNRLEIPQDPANPLPTQGISLPPVAVGEINCRYWTTTHAEVNSDTCLQMVQRYEITYDKLFMLNPGLARDCSNVQPKTDYCVYGCKYSSTRGDKNERLKLTWSKLSSRSEPSTASAALPTTMPRA